MGNNIRERKVWHPKMGERIECLIRLRSKTQAEVAKELGYSSGMMTQIIKKGSGMSRHQFVKLCKYLEVDPEGFELSFSFPKQDEPLVISCVRAIKNRNNLEHFHSAMALIKQDLKTLSSDIK